MFAVVTRVNRKDKPACYLVYEEGFETEEEADQWIEDNCGVGAYQFTSIDLDLYRTWTEPVKSYISKNEEVKYASIYRDGAD